MDAIERWEQENPLALWRRSKVPPLSKFDVFLRTGISYKDVILIEHGMAWPTPDQFRELAELTGDQTIRDEWEQWWKRRPVNHPSVRAS